MVGHGQDPVARRAGRLAHGARTVSAAVVADGVEALLRVVRLGAAGAHRVLDGEADEAALVPRVGEDVGARERREVDVADQRKEGAVRAPRHEDEDLIVGRRRRVVRIDVVPTEVHLAGPAVQHERPREAAAGRKDRRRRVRVRGIVDQLAARREEQRQRRVVAVQRHGRGVLRRVEDGDDLAVRLRRRAVGGPRRAEQDQNHEKSPESGCLGVNRRWHDTH